MPDRRQVAAPDTAAGARLDAFLAGCEGVASRAAAQKLLADGLVTVDGRAPGKSHRLAGGETVEYLLPDPRPAEAAPEDIPLSIVYEDESLLVVDKPKGMVVHPAPGTPDGTLVNALLFHCRGSLSGIGGVERPGIVHRIDKDTSGLLVVAKTDAAHQSLAAQIKAHSVKRIYQAVVIGRLPQLRGTVDAPIGRHPRERKKMAVTTAHARSAVTHYTVLEEFPGFTHAAFRLETGRTHQIRVHMAYLGHPILGDAVYGGARKEWPLEGQTLHAAVLGFVHPVTGEYLEFSSPLPPYFTKILEKLRKQGQ